MATAIGFMANVVTPARLGEFIRPYLLGRKEGISKTAAFGTVVNERAIDGLSIVVLTAMVLAFIEPTVAAGATFDLLKMGGYLIIVFYLVIFAILYLLHRRVKWMKKIIDFAVSLLPERFREKVAELIESFITGFDSLASGQHVIGIAIWSVILWGVAGGLNLAFFHAFDLDLPFIATYLILVAQVAGVMIPTPGYIGPFHAGTIAALSLYGVGEELAVSIAVVMHGMMFISNVTPGAIFLWTENFSLEKLTDKAEEMQDEEVTPIDDERLGE
jgi:hypothetical protein